MDRWNALLDGERSDTVAHLVDSYESGEMMVMIETDVESYAQRVLALPHETDCLHALRTAHDARQAYSTARPFYCRRCNGTGEITICNYPFEPDHTDVCPECVKQTVCPRCGVAFSMAVDGCEPCRTCGFEVSEDGLPEEAFCVCGTDRALYEGGSDSEFPE